MIKSVKYSTILRTLNDPKAYLYNEDLIPHQALDYTDEGYTCFTCFENLKEFKMFDRLRERLGILYDENELFYRDVKDLDLLMRMSFNESANQGEFDAYFTDFVDMCECVILIEKGFNPSITNEEVLLNFVSAHDLKN